MITFQRKPRRCVTGLLLAALLAGCTARENVYEPPPPPSVIVAQPVQQTVTLFIEENGETEVVERAEVRARVHGFLEEIKFTPGQPVKQGDVLYVIERDQYEANRKSASAAVAAAEAAIQVAQSQVGVLEVEVTRAAQELQRITTLREKGVSTQSQYDAAVAERDAAVASREATKANVQTATASRDEAQAKLDQAQLDLDYTIVKASISGRITKTEIKRGNLVENGSLMATIVNRERMYANFNVTDRVILTLQEMQQRRAGGTQPQEDFSYDDVVVELRREIDASFPFKGRLDYVNQEGVDQATGTFALRAVFDNPNDLILPGLFVRVRVAIGEREDALLVPEKAIARDQQGSFVLVVNGERKIERKTVTTGQKLDNMVVVRSGLEPADWIVVEGSQRARPGSEVAPSETTLSAPKRLPEQREARRDDDSESVQAPSGDGSPGDGRLRSSYSDGKRIPAGTPKTRSKPHVSLSPAVR